MHRVKRVGGMGPISSESGDEAVVVVYILGTLVSS